MLTLCKFCNSANDNHFPEGECYLCEGKMRGIDSLMEQAAGMIRDYSCFSVSTRLPKKWLVREERLWDAHIEKSENIKTYTNRHLNHALNKKTGKAFGNDCDVRITFDIDKQKLEAEVNRLMKQGWQPVGGISIDQNGVIYQAMIYSPAPKPPGKV